MITDIPNCPERYIQRISCPIVKICLKFERVLQIFIDALVLLESIIFKGNQHCMSLLIANEAEENVTEGCLYTLQMSFRQEYLAEEKMGKT